MDRETDYRGTSRDVGYTAFKHQQETIVCNVLSGRKVFVSLPKGNGKCFLLNHFTNGV